MDYSKLNKILDDQTYKSRKKAQSLLLDKGFSETEADELISYLYQHIPALKDKMRRFISGIVRWMLEGEFDPSEPNDLIKVNRLLTALRNSPAIDAYSNDFIFDISGKPQSLDEVIGIVDVDVSSDEDVSDFSNHNYKVIRLHNYNEALKYKDVADWCIFNSEEAFNDHLFNGTAKFYLILRDDYKSVPRVPSDNSPLDNYGVSVIGVVMGPDSEPISITSRWNSIQEADNFISMEKLEEIIGEETADDLYRVNDSL